MSDRIPLTDQQLDDYDRLAQAATPGPWCTDAWEIYQGAEYQPGLSMWIGETCRGTSSPVQDRTDAEFVAHARTAMPALVAEVRRLRTVVAAAREQGITDAAALLDEVGEKNAAYLLRTFDVPAAEETHVVADAKAQR
jgi:hypothetical protein